MCHVVFEAENLYQTIKIMKVRLDYRRFLESGLRSSREESAVGSGQEHRLLYVLGMRNCDIFGINSSCRTEHSLSRKTDLGAQERKT